MMGYTRNLQVGALDDTVKCMCVRRPNGAMLRTVCLNIKLASWRDVLLLWCDCPKTERQRLQIKSLLLACPGAHALTARRFHSWAKGRAVRHPTIETTTPRTVLRGLRPAGTPRVTFTRTSWEGRPQRSGTGNQLHENAEQNSYQKMSFLP